MAENVRELFEAIAPRYDLLNRLLSAGIDRSWRRRLVRAIRPLRAARILDLATGTADLAIEAARGGARVVGMDPSAAMLRRARRKIRRARLADRIRLARAAAERLPFPEAGFDAAVVAFGVRNFADPARGLAEARRVLRPGGTLAVLEFSFPARRPLQRLYRAYFDRLLPRIGDAISRRRGAYRYLARSVAAFPQGAAFRELLERAGFEGVREIRLTAGVATLWIARRRSAPR